MYFQFLIKDKSTEILIHHIMIKIKKLYPKKDIYYDSKSFLSLFLVRSAKRA